MNAKSAAMLKGNRPARLTAGPPLGITGVGGAAHTPAPPSSSSVATATAAEQQWRKQREELDRLAVDLALINQKISEARGESVPVSASVSAEPSSSSSSSVSVSSSASPFVSNIRSLAESDRRLREAREAKLSSLEALLQRVAEYDRLILGRTAPQTESGPKRRKSVGCDLFTLPTHLQLVDRLVDVFNASKRITVLRETSSDRVSSSAASRSAAEEEQRLALQRQTDALREHVQKLTEKLQVAESKARQSESDLLLLRMQAKERERESESLRENIASLEREVQENKLSVERKEEAQRKREQEREQEREREKKEMDSLREQLAHSLSLNNNNNNNNNTSNNDNSEELERLRARLHTLQEEHVVLEERLSNETAINQAMRNALLRKASALERESDGESDNNQTTGEGETVLDVPEDFQCAFKSLDHSLFLRLSSLRADVQLLRSVKNTLEGELSSAGLERDLMQQDLQTLSEQHGALTAAYHSLSLESALASKHSAECERLKAAEKVQVARLSRLESELDEARTLVKDAEAKWRHAESERTRLLSESSSKEAELVSLRTLVNSLQRKLRELGEGKNADTREYLDTFEEVLREEMTAMKGAFESKLQRAREDAEAMARRHQVEIARLQSSTHSGYSSISGSLKKL